MTAVAIKLGGNRWRSQPWTSTHSAAGSNSCLERNARLAWGGMTWPRPAADYAGRRPIVAAAGGRRSDSWVRGASLPQPLSQGSVGAAIDALTKSCSLVVIDLPRRLDDTVAEALCRCQLVVMVVPQVQCCCRECRSRVGLDTSKVTRWRSSRAARAPCGLLASDVADALDLPLLCDVAADVGLARRAEQGLPPRQARGDSSRRVTLCWRASHGIKSGDTEATPPRLAAS